MNFTADLNNLPQMLQFVYSEAERLGVKEAFVSKVELAVEEALVNIISYAYPTKEKESSIFISCSLRGSMFDILIKDQGVPFNPVDADVHIPKDIPIDQRKIGGLGIILIRKLIDELCYQREGKENILKLSFKVSKN